MRQSDTQRLRPNTQIPAPLLSGRLSVSSKMSIFMIKFISRVYVSADSAVPNPQLPPVLNVPPPPTCSQSMALQASLALWKYTAERVTL